MATKVTFEKIVGGCRALGYLDGRPCFAAGPLPGEEANVTIIRDRSSFVEASVDEIVSKAAVRTLPAEDHYMECSPWQNVEYGYQLELKRKSLAETFGRPDLALEVSQMVGATQHLAYRNKLEFSVKPSGARLDLAFHARGSFEDLTALPDGCLLGSKDMNKAALALTDAAHALKMGGYLETVTVRQSKSTGAMLGILALHQVPKRDFNELKLGKLAGIVVSRVRRRDQHEMIWHAGETSLVENLQGLDLGYAYDSFFQTNPSMFEPALTLIAKSVPVGCRLADLYGGVGTIGLAVSKIASDVVGIEVNDSSTEWANANADRNGILNYRAVTSAAERAEIGLLRGLDVVIVDPPRAGLHPNVIRDLLEVAPGRIIYLSCNPATQARDIKLLAEKYRAGSVTGFDFYPGTLHIESLVVLDRI